MAELLFDCPVLGVREIRDGDTFRLDLDVGFEHSAWPWLRLRGYSCPELSEPGGLAARDFARATLTGAGARVWVRTFKRPGYEDMRKSFARYLADVWLGDYTTRHADPGVRLGELLVGAGLAART